MPADSLVFVSGTPTLVDHGLNEDALPTLRTLLEMIEEKDRLVRLLTAYMEGPGLTVVIGTEHLSPDLQSLSLVATTYTDGPRTRAPSASSDPPGCATRAPLPPSRASRTPCIACSPATDHDRRHHRTEQPDGPVPNDDTRASGGGAARRRRAAAAEIDGAPGRPRDRQRRNATITATGCCARRPSSTTTASASIASAASCPSTPRPSC